MCGICGLLNARADQPQEELEAMALRMAGTLDHRGPDDQGVWANAAAGVALGHRRLSILDISPSGHQPMLSADGRWVTVFNGEIYNFAQVRLDLAAAGCRPHWRGHSDTEVLLEAVSFWGLEPALRRLNGMFALALWDRWERRLHLVRDRLGKKPLYYGWQGHHFLFASELKALRAHPAFAASVDRQALALYLRHNYVPSPNSIYEGISKLNPGSVLSIDPGRLGLCPPPVAYWSAAEMVCLGSREPLLLDQEQASRYLEELLLDAVRLRMVADVPLGAFLSGGIDSSLVVALMQAQSSRPVKTFCIGFNEKTFDEAPYARQVARHLGTEHTELYLGWDQALELVPRLPEIFDEPFADSSQIPALLVAQLARREVTVALSGDGGDELFCGYERYFLAQAVWRVLGQLPVWLRGAVARALAAVPVWGWDRLFGLAGALLPAQRNWSNPGERVQLLAQVMRARDHRQLYFGLVSHCQKPTACVVGVEPTLPAPSMAFAAEGPSDFLSTMMFWDLTTYLPDDILVKMDRTTMAAAVEARAPILDWRVVELAWRLPLASKVGPGGRGKEILRRILYRYVPPDLLERPKIGFGVPLAAWLRGPLRPWAETLLDSGRLRREGFLRPEPVRQMWREHLSGRRTWHYQLWDLLMFQLWLEHSRV